MAARVELPLRWAQVGLLGLGAIVGLLAGLDPKLALVAAFGMAFVAITLSNLTIGLCLFAVLTFVDSVLPSAGVVSLPKLMGALLMVSWLAYLTTHEGSRRRLFEHPGFLYVLMLFVAWVLLSVMWAEQSAPVLDAVFRYLPNALLFLITYSAIRTREQALWLIGAFVIGTLISAAYGMAVPTDPDAAERLSGAVGNANETAAALAAGSALAAALALALKEPVLRVAAAIVVPLCVYSIFLTLSRGGLVALAAVLLAGIVMAGRYRGPILIVTVIALLGSWGYFTVIAAPEAREHITENNGGTGRTDIWKVGWRMVEAEPVHGVGAGNFASSSVHYLIAPGAIVRDEFIVDTPKVAHNMYLEILAELGMIGFALFIGIIGYALYCALAAVRGFVRQGDRQMEIVSRALFVALIGLLVSDFFGSRQFSKQLWLLMSIAPALLALSRAGTEAEAEVEGDDGRDLPPYTSQPAAALS